MRITRARFLGTSVAEATRVLIQESRDKDNGHRQTTDEPSGRPIVAAGQQCRDTIDITVQCGRQDAFAGRHGNAADNCGRDGGGHAHVPPCETMARGQQRP